MILCDSEGFTTNSFGGILSLVFMAITGNFVPSCGEIMKASMYLMTGVAFSFGMLIGMLVRLPVVAGPGNAASLTMERHPRDLTLRGTLTESYLSEGWPDALSPGRSGDNVAHGQPIENIPGDIRQSTNTHTSNTTEGFHKLSDLVLGIQWSRKLENMCPVGFSEGMASAWKKQVSEGRVVHLSEGCGRMQNRLLTLQDSSKACARYRPNIDQIQGEIYSYHLAKVLGINNVMPTVLTMVKSVDPQWDRVNQEISMSQWADDKLVVLTKWMENLQSAYIPKEFQEQTRKLDPSDSLLLNKSIPELCELVQWSDLIVFDYLTANLDRVVNNMVNQQWNSQMMASPAHNLEKDKNSGRLLFLDNESGLLHGYRLLDKYASYHEALLESLCIFRESTINTVEKLFLDNNIGDELHKSLVLNEVYHEHLPRFPESNAKILNQRLGNVYDKIQRCRIQFDSR